MKIEKNTGSHDLCGGYTPYYNVTFSKNPITIKEALEEISLWVKTQPMGNGYARGTYVNDKIVESTWGEPAWRGYYNHEQDNEIVRKVTAQGGWCCGIDINLET